MEPAKHSPDGFQFMDSAAVRCSRYCEQTGTAAGTPSTTLWKFGILLCNCHGMEILNYCFWGLQALSDNKLTCLV